MRVADCIRDAGDMKGARREAFMTECQAAKARAAGDSEPPQAAPRSAASLAPVAPVAPPVQADGLPPQERILSCATASKGMQGDARSAYLKQCLTGPVQSSGTGATPAAIDAATLAPPGDEAEPRRRAACNVMARDKQGAARKAFIEQCSAARPARASAATSIPATTQATTGERLAHSKRCADEARAKIAAGEQMLAYMNACMTKP